MDKEDSEDFEIGGGAARLLVGDCLGRLKELPDNSVDAIVTDPPYALPGGFMGKQWDNHDGREDAGFGYWLAGFTDGEGCFRVQKHERGTHTCAFQIKLRRDDKAALERIRRFVGYGTVRDADGEGNSNPQAVYVVQDKEGCEALVGLFRRYPLTAKKANDFEVWAEAVWEWLERPRGNRWHGQADQSRAAALKARLEDVRRYTGTPWSGHKFQDWCRQWAAECLRVLKPGGHMLAFGAPRQYHRLAAGIEDAGFEVRDCVGWIFGSGFPKSKNLEGEWEGWGTALKPAWESIVVARKPLIGTVAENVLAHGTGALNIDACRVEAVDETDAQGYSAKCASVVGLASNINGNAYGEFAGARQDSAHELGRFPANLIHDGSPEVVALFPDSKGAGGSIPKVKITGYGSGIGTGESEYLGGPRTKVNSGSGSASRFFKQVSFDEEDIEVSALFFCAKASRRDRNEHVATHGNPNNHATVKPTELMRYLCRLVTRPGGVVVDPFTGSGTTGKAAMLEGFRFIGCELMPEYAQIARARISHAWEAAQPTPEIDDDQQLDLFPVELRKCSAM